MGTTVRVRGGKRDVQDGPYADTKEQPGGYIVLEVCAVRPIVTTQIGAS
jgi:hypothetical protein